MKLNLIDEFQLCVHPVIAGSGLPLFKNLNDRTVLKLIKTKTFSGGAILLY
jgi:dihydrofolate reductase